MAITKAISGNPTKNNSSTIVYGGTSTATINAPDRTIFARSIHGIYATNLTNGVAGRTKPYSSGTFAYLAKGKYIIVTNSTEISGVSSNLLLIPGSERRGTSGRRSINKMESRRSKLEVTAGWNYLGAFLSAPTVQVDSFGNDEAARPSLSIPGELTIMEGIGTGQRRLLATNKDYNPRTN